MSLANSRPISTADMEELLGDTMTEVKDTHDRVRELEEINLRTAKAVEVIAESIKVMSETFKRGEDRQDRLEVTNQELYKAKSASITPNVFFMVTGTLCVVIVLGAIWITDTSIDATLTSFKAGKEQAERLSEVKKEIIDEVRESH